MPGSARRTPAPAAAMFAPAPIRGSWTTGMTIKAVVLAGVVALAIALVFPSLRVYLAQQEELAQLRADRNAAQGEVEDLKSEIARWADPAFVVAQARERLAYVFPGETPYRVIDPEFVTGSAANSASALSSPTAVEDVPWFDDMWASIVTVGEGPVVPVPDAADLPIPDGEQLTPVDFGG